MYMIAKYKYAPGESKSQYTKSYYCGISKMGAEYTADRDIAKQFQDKTEAKSVLSIIQDSSHQHSIEEIGGFKNGYEYEQTGYNNQRC